MGLAVNWYLAKKTVVNWWLAEKLVVNWEMKSSQWSDDIPLIILNTDC